MGRANNTARSLVIISKQQGWDPNVIQDVGNGPGHPGTTEPDIEAVYHARETPYVMNTTDVNGIPGAARDAQQVRPDTSAETRPSFVTPELRENEDHSHSESYSHYKPGGGSQ